jgi:hypothetical protein
VVSRSRNVLNGIDDAASQQTNHGAVARGDHGERMSHCRGSWSLVAAPARSLVSLSAGLWGVGIRLGSTPSALSPVMPAVEHVGIEPTERPEALPPTFLSNAINLRSVSAEPMRRCRDLSWATSS